MEAIIVTLLAALVGSLWVVAYNRKPGLAAVAGASLNAAAVLAWYFHRDLPNSGWFLFLAVICALGTFSSLRRMIRK